MVCVLRLYRGLGMWANVVLRQAPMSLEVWTPLKDGFEVLLIWLGRLICFTSGIVRNPSMKVDPQWLTDSTEPKEGRHHPLGPPSVCNSP